MKLLILGGTLFLGRYLVEAALALGHEVTLFNRGQTNPNLFSDVEHLQGDRDSNLEALTGRSWDAVIDTSGYVPRIVRTSAELLKDAVDHYTFISSISVYADFKKLGLDEKAPVQTLENDSEENKQEAYGALKALCEQTVEQIMPGRVLTVRPGLIVGPHDPTGRFTYWVRRVAEGGEVLVPDKPSCSVQFIDVRDLAQWVVQMVEAQQTGVYNATRLRDTLTLGNLVECCKQVTGSDAHFTWVSEAFLEQWQVEAWTELPLWVPNTLRGFLAVDSTQAIQAGLKFRPLAQTIRDTWTWNKANVLNQSYDQQMNAKIGLERNREQQLLEAWHNLFQPDAR